MIVQHCGSMDSWSKFSMNGKVYTEQIAAVTVDVSVSGIGEYRDSAITFIGYSPY